MFLPATDNKKVEGVGRECVRVCVREYVWERGGERGKGKDRGFGYVFLRGEWRACICLYVYLGLCKPLEI